MAGQRKMLVALFATLLVCSAFFEANALRHINYRDLVADRTPCNGKNAGNCRPKVEANPYNRGCLKETRCRHGRKLLHIPEEH
ncbi:hypothetical protein LIER_02776 [Lithospermum erythrorhizon]|uniref:Uncharacterized protein n=1 Tax=Lithospermum erythrorhizon TaxID=34254 RepID=A0AAV3NQN5_LITER